MAVTEAHQDRASTGGAREINSDMRKIGRDKRLRHPWNLSEHLLIYVSTSTGGSRAIYQVMLMADMSPVAAPQDVLLLEVFDKIPVYSKFL